MEALQVIIIVLLNIFVTWVTSYLSTKGKLTAINENIEESTTTIKNIESSIDIKTSSRVDFEKIKRDELINLIKSRIQMLHALTEASGSSIVSFDNKNVRLITDNIEKKIQQFESSVIEVQIFIEDEEFNNINNEILTESRNWINILCLYLFNHSAQFISEKSDGEKTIRGEITLKEHGELQNTRYEKLKTLLIKYYEERKPIELKISTLSIKQLNKTREYLKVEVE